MLLRQQQSITAEKEQTRKQQDWIQSHKEGYGPLKEEEAILMSTLHLKSLIRPLVSWHMYFRWRELSSSSVVAPLLSSALSIYYIITSLVPIHSPDLNFSSKKFLKIHLIESYRELHTLATLWELTVLLPHVTFDLVFACAHLPSWFHNMKLYMYKKDEEGSVTIATEPPETSDTRTVGVRVHCGEYESLQDREPDLIVGFRPSFVRKASTWRRILPKLKSVGAPAFFCEISEYRCANSVEVVRTAVGGAVSEPMYNPFHCPLRITGGDNKLPKYSNAFIFCLIHTKEKVEKEALRAIKRKKNKNK
ncbi:zinc finger MYND domain-containing protein 15-like [Boleophthalmus pectinirostris]|uniref:zinc finger MYND domain-containing protein 15-like n=1 Tax=Boleophthalmus pectinirostris TaxID=150288 RepID=UPI00242BC58E|nr:zinc finger MYND domain-containing protein 15-like [Boleophthalmus pectinirostris]